MSVFEINKIVGAVLVTALITMLISMAGDALIEPVLLDKPANRVAAVVAVAADEAAPVAVAAAGDVEKGKKTAKKCAACHSFKKGGKNKLGPPLWGIVGAARGGREGYRYSPAMKASGGTWSAAELAAFLADPKAAIPGTKMVFRGLKKEKDLANLLAFLKSLADAPPSD